MRSTYWMILAAMASPLPTVAMAQEDISLHAASGSASYQMYDRGSNSDNRDTSVMNSTSTDTWFGDGNLVATSTLSNYVTGAEINGSAGGGTSSVNSGISLSGNAFQNGAGISSNTINTGAAASQNSAISVSTAPVH